MTPSCLAYLTYFVQKKQEDEATGEFVPFTGPLDDENAALAFAFGECRWTYILFAIFKMAVQSNGTVNVFQLHHNNCIPYWNAVCKDRNVSSFWRRLMKSLFECAAHFPPGFSKRMGVFEFAGTRGYPRVTRG